MLSPEVRCAGFVTSVGNSAPSAVAAPHAAIIQGIDDFDDWRSMNKPKFFRALAYALLATSFATLGALSTPPVSAYAADKVEVTDEMANSDGLIMLDATADYVVSEDLHHAIYIYKACTLTFLNGSKLVVEDAGDAIAIESNGYFTINNANVQQKNSSGYALRDNGGVLTLNDCKFVSDGPYCVYVQRGGPVYCNGEGSYEVTSSSATAIFYIYYTTLFFNGGSCTAPSNVTFLDEQTGRKRAQVSGGSFSSPDAVDWLNGDKVMQKPADGPWKVVDSSSELPEYAKYKVVKDDRTYAYCATESDANAMKSKLGRGAEVSKITYAVSFDADGGSPAPESQEVDRGDLASKPGVLYKAGFEFVKWVDGDDATAAEFDFSAPVLSDHSLKAIYNVNETRQTVVYDANGGAFSGGRTSVEQTYIYATTSEALSENPVRTGKVFTGWELDGSAYEFGQPVTSSFTLKAGWADPVAECGGVKYGSLQDALDAAKGGDTVKLLAKVEITDDGGSQGISCDGVKNLTLDLGGYGITYKANATDQKAALTLKDCENLVITGGYVEGEGVDCIRLMGCKNYKLSFLAVEANGEYGAAARAVSSSGQIKGGSYEAADYYHALDLWGGTVKIDGGAFTGGEKTEDYEPVSIGAYRDAVVSIIDGTFFGGIRGSLSSVHISGGTYDSPWVASYVDEGYALLKEEGESGSYEVVGVDSEGIPANACWSVTVSYDDEEEETADILTVYYESGDDAQAFLDEYKEALEDEDYSVTLTRLRYKVSFESQGEVASTRLVRAGQAVGELPAGEEVAGWTFSGWYLDKEKVDANYIPGDDVTLVAMWTKDDSGDESDDPDKGDKGDDPDDPDKGDEGDSDKDSSDKDGSSDKGKKDDAMPQTGDSTNSALPVAIAVAGVAVVAAGLVFHARSKRK